MLIVSLTCHEAAHAWTADRLGDPTARLLGRLSLNPAVHIDPIGTMVFPLMALATGVPLIGWAKPVPVNIANLARAAARFCDRRAAGPVSNLLWPWPAAVMFAALCGAATRSALAAYGASSSCCQRAAGSVQHDSRCRRSTAATC